MNEAIFTAVRGNVHRQTEVIFIVRQRSYSQADRGNIHRQTDVIFTVGEAISQSNKGHINSQIEVVFTFRQRPSNHSQKEVTFAARKRLYACELTLNVRKQ